MKIHVLLRFYEELNDFLSIEKRKREFTARSDDSTTVKHLIESLGIPHCEVDLILVNGRSVSFSYVLKNSDRISVYPKFESFDISTISKLRGIPLRNPLFILDVHLGRLAGFLRLLGFDARYRNDYSDIQIVRLSLEEGRTILTRDRELLKIKQVTRGYWVRSVDPETQLKEVIRRFELTTLINPFSICLTCNSQLEKIDKKKIRGKISPKTYAQYNEFSICGGCGKIYWKGSHYRSMIRFISENGYI